MSAWVRSGALVGAPRLIDELGGDATALALSAGIDAAAFGDPEFPVPTAAVVSFLESAAASCCCDSFGLRLAQRQDMSLLGPLWSLVQSSTTVGEMLADLARVFFLHTTGVLLSLESAKGGLLLNYQLATGAGAADRHTTELGIAILVNELSKSSPNWKPKRIFFRHGPPKDLRLHRQIFGSHISFSADRNALFIEDAILAMRYGSGDIETHRMLATRFNAQCKQLPELFRTQTESAIRSLMSVATCDVVCVAKVLNLSTRSLQRYLIKEKTSFSAVLDGVRADLALKYLRQSELPIAAIAELLGFSETSALTRACRRWYGQSPRTLRLA
ncbi:MAG: AraC family transcriptional regulator [Pseudomonas sp.]|nr:AraC family transcriptional regulator [Pseudomonas sp.]